MPSSRARPLRTLLTLSAAILVIALSACSSGGPKQPPSADAKSAAYVPSMGDSDLIVPEGHGLPPQYLNLRGEAGHRQHLQAPAAVAGRPAQPGRAQPTRAQPQQPLFNRDGPQIRVTWEALAVERDRYENPRHARRPQLGAATQLKAVLVSESHIEAQTNMRGLTARKNRGVAVAPIPDSDIKTFVQGLEQRGFFRLARPTSSVAHLMRDPNARGHITVERGGESHTLISMRGQGLNPATKQIPAIYSEAKQSILMLRNTCSSMSVVGLTGGVLTR